MTIPTEILRSPARLAHHLTNGAFQLPRHIDFLSTRIAASLAKGNARILVTVPPQHGKSTLISRWLHIWTQALWPGNQNALVSYEARFASWHGGATRDLAIEFGAPLGIGVVNGKDAAAGDWTTTAGGRVFSTGIGGPLTGRGFDFIDIDDPVKNHEEAESQVVRQAHWDWYESTARTRLRPGGSILVVMTRWHPEDLIGRLLAAMESGGEQWEIIRLPALAESGDVLERAVDEALWPERYGTDVLDGIRRAMPRKFASMYQGSPRYPEGAMFRRDWFDFVDEPLSKDYPHVRAWDLAGTEPGSSGDPDWTVGTLLGVRDGRVVIEDVQRFRAAAGQVRQRVCSVAAMDGRSVRIKLQQDPGQAGKDQIESYATMLFGYAVESAPVTGDKATRAEPMAAAAQLRRISLVRAPWNAEFLAEIDGFPEVPHDDQIDAASDAFNVLARLNIPRFDPVAAVRAREAAMSMDRRDERDAPRGNGATFSPSGYRSAMTKLDALR